ncbi:MAG: flagellar export protein FliJ [Pirellulaceae bacterium]|nr:flagellar export protein FliJ [Pirellulaceae bacterium]
MFRFRLQTVLELRIAERDERRGELAKALRAAEILQERRQQLTEEMTDNQELARKLAEPGKANIDRLLQTHRYEAILKGTLAQLVAQEKQVAAEIERRRHVLTEADRQVRVLEKLQERKREEHARGELRQEMKQLDEVAAVAFIRRRSEQHEEAAP